MSDGYETERYTPGAGAVGFTLSQFRLTELTTTGTAAVFEIDAPHVSIGAASNNDVVLSDSTVSSHHCVLESRGEGYRVRDLESTNGTRVDGVRVVEAFLDPGARLRLGAVDLLFDATRTWLAVEPTVDEAFGHLVGSSDAMRATFAMLARVAATELTCLITGETGTGKELAARSIHAASRRSGSPFVVVDCGALTEGLVESQLFGHERGAFTGAEKRHAGCFETASGGTVFLDEIGDLPLELQPKLLRVLERREVCPLGSAKHIPVDVRVLAATHRDLAAMVEEGGFREDLFYRLAEVAVALPPLRERPEDIRVLGARILADLGGGATLAPDALAALEARAWPGNVRELRNVLRRAAALAPSSLIDARALATSTPAVAVATPASDADLRIPIRVDLSLKDARTRWLEMLESAYLARVVDAWGADPGVAAEKIGVHRKSFFRLLKQYGIKRT